MNHASNEEKINLVKEIIYKGEQQKMYFRLFGSLAYWHLCPRSRVEIQLSEVRNRDIDLCSVFYYNQRTVERLFDQYGFVLSIRMDQGRRHMRFETRGHDLVCDLYIGQRLWGVKLTEKLFSNELITIPATELLITKLNIHSLADKDFQDIVMLLKEHLVLDNETDAQFFEDYISLSTMKKICSKNYYTLHNVLNSLILIRNHCKSSSDFEGVDLKIDKILQILARTKQTFGSKICMSLPRILGGHTNESAENI